MRGLMQTHLGCFHLGFDIDIFLKARNFRLKLNESNKRFCSYSLNGINLALIQDIACTLTKETCLDLWAYDPWGYIHKTSYTRLMIGLIILKCTSWGALTLI